MNKPAEPAAVMAALEIDHIPLAAITPSPSNPRKYFAADYLKELAASIKAIGVIQPVVVRAKPGGKYELVVGECRWRASKIAGTAHIPALIRSLTDVEVLELQITENLQRNDLQPMEEAEGYESLIKLRRGQGETLLAEQLADKIGKSRSYVYQRIKLLELCPAGRKALAEGLLDVSRALLVARIPSEDLQKKALDDIKENPDSYDDEPMSYRQAHQHIQDTFMLRLADAPFDAKDAGLVEKAGPCTTCPKRTGNAPDLFGDVKSKDVCTDPKCFAAKKQALAERSLKDLEAKGKAVIKGEDAAAIVRESYYDDDNVRVGGGYVSLDDICSDDPKRRKVRDVVGTKHTDKVEVVQAPKGGLVQVIKTSALKEILNEKGIKTAGQQRAKQAQKTRAENEKAEIEERIIQGVLQAIHDKHPGKPSREDLLLVANALADSFDNHGGYNADSERRIELALDCDTADLRKVIKGMKQEDLVRFLVVMALVLLDTTPEIRAMAKRLKVDETKIRKEVLKTAAAADEEEPEEAPATKNGKKK